MLVVGAEQAVVQLRQTPPLHVIHGCSNVLALRDGERELCFRVERVRVTLRQIEL